MYDDDVEPKTIQYAGPKAGEVVGGKIKVSTVHRKRVELEETNLNVLLELTGAGDNLDRQGIDLVTVLDVSGSMKKEGRIDDLKIAMRFLIRKLSYIDRLSVVTFSTEAKRLRQLLPMTEEAQDLTEKDVDDLKAHGYTYMAHGLTEALQVLNDRKHKDRRSPVIMFMSDGDPSDGVAATKISPGDVPVYTFAVGSDFKSDVLKQIARNGGTFSITRLKNLQAETSNLSDAFAKCLGGLLNVAVENLIVTLKPFEEEIETEDGNTMTVKSTIRNVSAGLYPQSPGPDGSKTVTFYDLYKQEKRSVLVELALPAVPEEVVIPVLEVAYSYRGENGSQLPAQPIKIPVTRTNENPEKERVEVIVEKKRLETIKQMETAKGLADNKNLPGARKLLEDTHKSLDAENVDDSTKLIQMLKDELRLLIDSMRDEKTYNEIGRHLLDAALIAHKLQRSATVGNAEKLQMYATEIMKEYIEQVKEYENEYQKQVEEQKKDPSKVVKVTPPPPSLPPTPIEPPTPPPPVNPPRADLSAIAPQLTTHIGEALKALETMQASLKAIYDVLNNVTA